MLIRRPRPGRLYFWFHCRSIDEPPPHRGHWPCSPWGYGCWSICRGSRVFCQQWCLLPVGGTTLLESAGSEVWVGTPVPSSQLTLYRFRLPLCGPPQFSPPRGLLPPRHGLARGKIYDLSSFRLIYNIYIYIIIINYADVHRRVVPGTQNSQGKGGGGGRSLGSVRVLYSAKQRYHLKKALII